ncbi:MAG: acetolactate synthase large subunit [Firmicutes bacterium]|nr:acetolactate synthase large subunit [Bacillota bacterium]
MKQRVADYIADYLVACDITDVFTVVGGGAMHLNDAFGQHKGLNCTYNHHEQASAIAAEGYAKIKGNIAVVCVTTGPGGTNALTGVLCAYQDSIPMLVISGQTRYNTTVESTGLDLRQFGEQEYSIIRSAMPMTKYAQMVRNPLDIRYHLEKALYIAQTGRRGPCWLDVPLDVQGAIIETDDLCSFTPEVEQSSCNNDARKVLEYLKNAKRPVILAGSGIRSANALVPFRDLIESLNIPVICATSISDLLPVGHRLCFGNFGVFGGRAGNFILQNADVILTLGCRMSFKQIGFNFNAFAPQAYKIVVDVDAQELKKDTIHIDLPIHSDILQLLKAMDRCINQTWEKRVKWLEYCTQLYEGFPIFQPKHEQSTAVNPYYFAQVLGNLLKDDGITVVGNSCACVAVLQSGVRHIEQRLFGNVNCGTMGYDLPAAIGATVASKKTVVCITGDGSIQMNLQELQTIVHNQLPIKMMVFNNGGYQAIVQTQTNFFEGRLSGCTKESGVSFPNIERIAYAYGIPYMLLDNHEELYDKLKVFFEQDGYGICEVIQDITQTIEPKIQSKKLPDGTMISPPIDDLAPFLDKKIYSECRYCEGDV